MSSKSTLATPPNSIRSTVSRESGACVARTRNTSLPITLRTDTLVVPNTAAAATEIKFERIHCSAAFANEGRTELRTFVCVCVCARARVSAEANQQHDGASQ